MKKLIFPIFSLLSFSAVMAQGEFDALKYSQLDINGSARYMSMAGAFGAVGGDGSAIGLNPAGLGIYRSSELSLTTGVYYNSAESSWNGKASDDNRFKVPFNNFTYVINLTDKDKKKGLVSSNFAFTFNKLKNFNRNMFVQGSDQSSSMTDYWADLSNQAGLTVANLTQTSSYEPYRDSPYPAWGAILAYDDYLMNYNSTSGKWVSTSGGSKFVVPNYALSEEGYINEWAFSYAANISNQLYLGASVGIQDLNYSANSQYTEDFYDNTSKAHIGGFTLENDFLTEGTGANFKIGSIFRPAKAFRVGVSLQTPTFYKLTDTHSASVGSSVNGTTYSNKTLYVQESYYKLEGPMQYDFSGAVFIGKKGLISADYGIASYTGMKLRDDNGRSNAFSAENQNIKDNLQDAYTLRVGAEYKVSDEVSLRCGYANVSSSTKDNASKSIPLNSTRTDVEYFLDGKTNYYTAGIGYHENNWFLDFVFMKEVSDQDYYPYSASDVKPASITTTTNNFLVTVGLKY